MIYILGIGLFLCTAVYTFYKEDKKDKIKELYRRAEAVGWKRIKESNNDD